MEDCYNMCQLHIQPRGFASDTILYCYRVLFYICGKGYSVSRFEGGQALIIYKIPPSLNFNFFQTPIPEFQFFHPAPTGTPNSVFPQYHLNLFLFNVRPLPWISMLMCLQFMLQDYKL